MTNRSDDINDVLNAVHEYFASADRGDWETYRELHADQVEVDFGGLNEGSNGAVAADDMLRSARDLLGPVHLTQHMISTEAVTVDGDTAIVGFYEQALHHHPALGDDPEVNTWTVFGHGEHRWERTDSGWRLVAAKLVPTHNTGNVDLLAAVGELTHA